MATRPTITTSSSTKKFLNEDNVRLVTQRLDAMETLRCLVGIPDDSEHDPVPGQPPTAPISNAAIGFAQEFGVPSQNIPARPFLMPGIANAEPAIIKQLERGFRLSLQLNSAGDPIAQARAVLEACGTVAVNAVVQKITDGPFAPLAQATIAARAARGHKGAIREMRIRQGLRLSDNPATRAAMGLKQTSENVRPLIDTGALRRSIVYSIVNR